MNQAAGINDFVIKIANVNGTGSASANALVMKTVFRMGVPVAGKNFFPSIREYKLLYGLTAERLKVAQPNVVVMHPGPVNRGVEIGQEVADGPHSVIHLQVTNGIAVRMAVLYLLAQVRAVG